MIDRALDQGFVLEQAERLRTELEAQSLEEGDNRARQAVQAAVLHALLTEPAARESLQPASRKAWIPRNGVLSVLQTTIEERIRAEFPGQLEATPGFAGGGGPLATRAIITDDPEEGVGDFTKLDPNWISSIAAALVEKFLLGPHLFDDTREAPEARLARDARVILVGDWGTGGPAADDVATAIRAKISEAGKRDVHVVHLGDVYYSGEKWEAQERFLDHWPIARDHPRNHRSWCLAGNHDMYSGGYGYYDVILEDERFSGQKAADSRGMSFFRLANDEWQLLGLDSSWSDDMLETGHLGRLAGRQADWILKCIEERPRRTVLLSHHQLRSGDHAVDSEMARKVAWIIEKHALQGWFWGHVHKCMTFGSRPGLAYAACVGHGAMPEPVGETHAEPGEWEYDVGRADGDGDHWRLCGFAMVDFTGDTATVSYINEKGETHAEEPLR